MSTKPILFNTEMVRAILENRKSVTRRVVKQQQLRVLDSPYHKEHPETPDRVLLKKLCEPPYRPGDILYVPERWKCSPDSQLWYEGEYRVVFPDGEVVRFYFAEQKRLEKWRKYIEKPLNNWQSPYFMPREAARIFLRVTDVRVERLQDITDDDLVRDFGFCLDAIKAVGRYDLAAPFWNSTIKKADLPLYGWDANPWVWVIGFERCEKPKGD